MTARDDAIAAVDAFGASEYSRGNSDGKSAQLASDQTTYNALKAEYDAYRAAHPDTAPQSELLEFSDFAVQLSGKYVPTGSLVGKGVDITTWQMKPHTNTKTAPTSSTNQYRLMRVGGLGASSAAKVDVGEFTLRGSDQDGMYYGGLTLGYGSGSRLHNLKILGIPGYSSSPPGETFSLALFHADGATLDNVTVLGKDVNGTAVAASLVGYNFTTGTTTANNLVCTDAKYGFGVAMWRCVGRHVFNKATFKNCRKVINIEQSVGGAVYDFNSCDFRGNPNIPYVAQVTSITSSSVVNFRDPLVDSWPLKVNVYGASANSGTNTQKDADIHLYINGVDVSKDTSKLLLTHL